MTLNRECYLKSLKSDAMMYGKFIFLCGVGILTIFVVICAASQLDAFIRNLVFPQISAVNVLLISLILPLLLHCTVFFTDKEIKNTKELTAIYTVFPSMATMVIWGGYEGFSKSVSLNPACPGYLSGQSCIQYLELHAAQPPFPDMVWVVCALIVYFIISTPFIVAYIRCKDG